MESTKPALGMCELPTGVNHETHGVLRDIQYRELAGPEEDILASNLPASTKVTQMMFNCTKSIGPVDQPQELRKMIDKLVITDRLYYLVKLRAHSLGPQYQFELECPQCQVVDKVSFDLNQLKVDRAPKADELYKTITLPSGKIVRFKVGDGQTDAAIEKMAKPDNAPSVALFARVTEIDAKPVNFVDIKEMSMRDRGALRKAIDEAEGEFDDEFDAECPKCGNQYKGTMQLDAQSFFSP